MTRPRLKKGDISIAELLQVSAEYYKKYDNKRWRAELDVLSAKITGRRNLKYNPSTKEWEQTGRECKFTFIVTTDPKSYKKQDSLPKHRYPVIFLLRDFDSGIFSPFRSRVGSFKKWKKSGKKISEGKSQREKDSIRKDNKKIQEQNIRNGLQGDFIFRQMWVWNKYDLLFGPLTCENRPPKKTNPTLFPYFSKHEYWIIKYILIPLLGEKKHIVKNKLFKGEE